MASNQNSPRQQNADSDRVVVLFGGWSKEREVSLDGGIAVLRGLQASGVDALGLDAGEDWMDELRAMAPDQVFIMLHGSGGEDGVVQGALESMNLPYTGSGVLASALAMDKIRCKQFWFGIGLPTPAFEAIGAESDWSAVLESLGGSAMVKPASEGSSLGMSKAASPDQLREAWALAKQYDDQILAEQWLSGAEYTVAIVNGKALPTIKLETDRGFYDYEAKYLSDDTRYLCPCGLSLEEDASMQAMAIKAYESLGCRGWGRVDLMMDSEGQCYVLEVNTVPGMTDHSLVPMAATAKGMSFNTLLLEILDASRPGKSAMGAKA